MPLTRFILNDLDVQTQQPLGMTVLDFVRYHRKLTGTKIGCREGDCGACTVLVGELAKNRLIYRSMTSCLMPLGNAAGKHLVTIEGLNLEELTPIQRAIAEEGGTQCGFCTVGFVVSLAGFCLSDQPPSFENAVAAIDGNICRCTGYKSIERAAAGLADELSQKNGAATIDWLIQNRFLPAYFKDIPARLQTLPKPGQIRTAPLAPLVGGGTDLFVQKPEAMAEGSVKLVFDRPALKGIRVEKKRCIIGGGATAQDLRDSQLMAGYFPMIKAFMKLISSTPIRNMGTLAGNFINASPIGDLTIFFLALDSDITLVRKNRRRNLALKNFYKGYKTLDRNPHEILETVSFEVPGPNTYFNFEKVSKRTHLDIASVNSAMGLKMKGSRIEKASVSAGGVAPVPLYLKGTSAFLEGREVSSGLVKRAAARALDEIAPISDARGSAAYKRLLLRQLIYAHFLTFFPERVSLEALV